MSTPQPSSLERGASRQSLSFFPWQDLSHGGAPQGPPWQSWRDIIGQGADSSWQPEVKCHLCVPPAGPQPPEGTHGAQQKAEPGMPLTAGVYRGDPTPSPPWGQGPDGVNYNGLAECF